MRARSIHLLTLVLIVAVGLLLPASDAHAQQQYGVGLYGDARPDVRPAPAVLDCRPLPAAEKSIEKSQPWLQLGHAGRFAAATASCIRLDYWPVIGQGAGGPGSNIGLDLVVYTETGEALESNSDFGIGGVTHAADLFDAFGRNRGRVSLLAATTGCSIVYVRVVVDGVQIIPRSPATYEQFRRYVTALGAGEACQ